MIKSGILLKHRSTLELCRLFLYMYVLLRRSGQTGHSKLFWVPLCSLFLFFFSSLLFVICVFLPAFFLFLPDFVRL